MNDNDEAQPAPQSMMNERVRNAAGADWQRVAYAQLFRSTVEPPIEPDDTDSDDAA